jgi:hypothetical protein
VFGGSDRAGGGIVAGALDVVGDGAVGRGSNEPTGGGGATRWEVVGWTAVVAVSRPVVVGRTAVVAVDSRSVVVGR